MEEKEQRALDEQCAHALGYDTIWADSIFGHTLYLWDKGAVRTPYGASNCHVLGTSWEKLRIDGEVRELMVRICPAFAGRDVKILEDEVERRGLVEAYQNALIAVLGLDMQVFNSAIELNTLEVPEVRNNTFEWEGHASLWKLIRAAPEQRARAFLEVMECKSK
jgi:hypothetical protein